MKRQGRKSKAQTPAPKSERIKGSSKNPTGTAASKKSAESIKFSPAIITVLEKKKDEYNKKHKSKVTLSTLKAVFRRGSGAYSSSHRPTITGGMPNSRSAWAYARVNAFLRKKGGGYAKKSYVQDDDLMEEGGEIKSNDMKLLAPNGKPSNLTHEQYKLVRTPAFKTWFGDWENDPENASKVVDENGEPLILYHGTIYSDFNTFLPNENEYEGYKVKYWFTTDLKYASGFTNKNKVRIINAFLNVREPKYDQNIKISDTHDGYIDTLKKRIYVVAVINSNQIKLADGSNVTFDPNNPDIRYEKGGQVNDLINQGIVELKMFNTTPEHAKEYGFNSKNPLYLQSIYISEDYRLKGIGSKVFEHIIDYAEKNQHDLIFGHITQEAEPDVDVIKKILNDKVFNTTDGNNDFYKIIDRKYSDGGKLKNELVQKELNGTIKPLGRNKYIVKGKYRNIKKHQLELIDLLKSLGFEIFGIDKGATTNSRYFDFEKGNLIGHIRISDHTTADVRTFKFLEMESRRYYVLSVRNNEWTPNIYIDIEILTSEDFQYIKEWFMDTNEKFAKGGEVKHNQGAAGGYLVGNRHSEGGIKAINKSTGQALEMEGGEVVITRNAVNDNTKREFNGKMMTNKEILSAINVSGGGVSFADGGKVSECTCSGRRYKFGGRLMKDYEVIEEIRNQYPADFKKGVGEEMSEHEETFKLLVKRKLTPKQAAERVVAEHLQKKPDYYDNYAEGGTIDIMGRKIMDYQSFQKGGIPVKSPYVGESDEYYKVYHPSKKTHVYAKGGNIRRAFISPLLAYKNFLHMIYDINFNELPSTLKNALLQGKQNLVDKYIA